MTVSERALGLVNNRADTVRERRVRRTRRVERAERIQVPKQKRKRTPRRRYSVTLSAERGAEVQLTAGGLGTRVFSMFIVILALGSLIRFTRSDQFKVGQITVEGNLMLPAAQIRSLAGIEGQSIFFLDPVQIKSVLEEAAEVKEATIRMAWPNRIEVHVDERYPAVEWNDAGRIWWLSVDGVAYVQHGEGRDLIKVHSEQSYLHVSDDAQEPVVNPALMKAVASLNKQLPEVTSWNYDQVHGLGFVDERGWQIYFGTEGDIPMKVRIYESIVEKLEADGIQVTMISIEDSDAPYYATR